MGAKRLHQLLGLGHISCIQKILFSEKKWGGGKTPGPFCAAPVFSVAVRRQYFLNRRHLCSSKFVGT